MSDPVTFTHRIEAFGYDLVTGILRLLPFAFVSWLGGVILRGIGPLTSKHKIARTNLKIAFPDANEAELKRLLSEQWDNTGRTFAEFALTDRIRAFEDQARVTVEGLDIFLANAPAIIATGHFANWEVMATVLTQSSSPVRVTYRKINNPLIDRRVREQREAYGTKFLVQKSTHRGGRELFEALHNGESIAIMNDQKFNTGLKIPFFGVDAMTAQGAVRLALKTERPILPMSVVRNKATFHVRFYPPLDWTQTGQRKADVAAGVEAVTRFIENRIRENPAQWFWVHRRWPKLIYRSDA
ncbi:lipid A biosynthesis lauroyl acyltransferase [Algimonas ampicilliniresistens]|uniref:Lipid A biosynthesis lauroyl acyltransferase n=1 Tax=Algimonas ampicilliniresistens TaxID=1298735 RepID=A0ABQ5V6T5_9PROT|nr:lysophospholipid acyltransferase family protein [Algimonas ampicilliniresistens]GLQ22712.1 lipid A biosynthesis lauroyl acyltransferase [Algimonas ampicilliniresistens]